MDILTENELLANPIKQFELIFIQAKTSGKILLPEAMCLSTINKSGYPDSRMVLLKGSDERGFVFYTNYNSTKGKSLAINPNVSLLFHWLILGKMIRIRGKVEKVTAQEADEYFETRPRESQIGAWASLQSEVLPSRKILEDRYKEYSKQFENGKVPRPSHWSGYRVLPEEIEFWQEREFRLHDRFVYNLQEDGSWNIQRLYP